VLPEGVASWYRHALQNEDGLQKSLIGLGSVVEFQRKYLALVASRWPSLMPSQVG
jgi:hypothetical protein